MPKHSINHKEVAWKVVDDEAVIINNQTTFYYGLNKTGTFIWNLIAETPLDTKEIASQVSAHFGKTIPEVTNEVEDLLQHLKKESLILERG